MNWELWKGDDHAWDDLVLTLPDQTVYQGATWASHRAEFGWRVIRLTATQSGRLTAAAQVLVREYPLGVRLAWVPGGPLGRPSAWGAAFRTALALAIGARQSYVRTNIIRAYAEVDEQEMLAAGWRRPRLHLNSGFSLEYDLSPTEQERIALTNRMWRRNLRSAEKTGVPSRQWGQTLMLCTRRTRLCNLTRGSPSSSQSLNLSRL